MAHILAEPVETGGCGKRVLLMDLDPQSNLTIHAEDEEKIGKIWEEEDNFFEEDGFEKAKNNLTNDQYKKLLNHPRSIHFLLKPTEEGISDETILSPPVCLNKHDTLHLLPGRLSLFKYESVIAQRWGAAYLGDPLSIRTITKIRNIAITYAQEYHYDYVIMDTSPSLGALNKVIISMADGFIIPAFPDLFSYYGIRNIGEAITLWQKEFATMKNLLSEGQAKDFPDDFANFLGYTIYNAKRYESIKGGKSSNRFDLSSGHSNYAEQFPEVVEKNILSDKLPKEVIKEPIGGKAIIYGHNTYTAQAQQYKKPV
ncbi:MAG: AAA family ATPase, partial [Bacteroidia bacterium]|nr:AAA family ATPase [Bacteroidia bacterium]